MWPIVWNQTSPPLVVNKTYIRQVFCMGLFPCVLWQAWPGLLRLYVPTGMITGGAQPSFTARSPIGPLSALPSTVPTTMPSQTRVILALPIGCLDKFSYRIAAD